jgi:hypothetical protein
MIDPHVILTPPRLHKVSGVPRDLIYAALKSGDLPAVKRGRVWLIGGAAAIEWLARFGQGSGNE